jgi:hypothetical protein
MMLKKMVCISVIGFIVVFFATTAYASGTEEVLLGIDITTETIELHVASGGCTTEEHFEFEINIGTTGTIVTIWRVIPDDCKALLPDGVRLSFDKEEIGLGGINEFTITNKIGNTSQHR